MLDIKFVRENPDIVKENIKKKFQDHKLPMVEEVIELDAERRKTQQAADDLKAARNKLSRASVRRLRLLRRRSLPTLRSWRSCPGRRRSCPSVF